MPQFDDQTRDTALPVFTPAQAAEFHALLDSGFGRRGLPHRWNGDASYDIDGAVFGLDNLAAALAEHPVEDWPAMVDRHIDIFVDLTTGTPPAVELAMIFPRVRRRRTDRPCPYAVPLVGDLEVMLAVDYPSYVAELDVLDRVARLGSSERIWEAAWANLRALPDPTVELVGPEDGSVQFPMHAFGFEDYFGPSRLLLRNEFLLRHLPPAPYGHLVAIPDRHTMVVSALTNEVPLQCRELAAIAEDLYETSPGAASPALYHVCPDDTLDEIAYLVADGSVYLKLNDVLAMAMGEH